MKQKRFENKKYQFSNLFVIVFSTTRSRCIDAVRAGYTNDHP